MRGSGPGLPDRAYSGDSLKHEDKMHEEIVYGFGQREVALVDIQFRLVGKNPNGAILFAAMVTTAVSD